MNHILEALEVLKALGMPDAQQNERTALCLLALLNLTPDKSWGEAEAPLIGITPMMEFAATQYGRKYAPNSRETFRRFSMHQLVDAGIALYNPDQPDRPVNSPKAVYQIAPEALHILQNHGQTDWAIHLKAYLEKRQTLAARYAKEREMHRIPVHISEGQEITLSPGEHSLLIRHIVEQFGSSFASGSQLVYVGDTGDKWGYFDMNLLASLNVLVDTHGKMPDVVLYQREKNWLFLVESVTSHGPVDNKRYEELNRLFANCTAGLVFVSAFPDRRTMGKYLSELAWETEVWVADHPTHLIHFNGDRFLGPRSPNGI